MVIRLWIQVVAVYQFFRILRKFRRGIDFWILWVLRLGKMRAGGKRLKEGIEGILEELDRLLKNGGRIFSLMGVILEVMEGLMRRLKGLGKEGKEGKEG